MCTRVATRGVFISGVVPGRCLSFQELYQELYLWDVVRSCTSVLRSCTWDVVSVGEELYLGRCLRVVLGTLSQLGWDVVSVGRSFTWDVVSVGRVVEHQNRNSSTSFKTQNTFNKN